jgi:hypothetical protein
MATSLKWHGDSDTLSLEVQCLAEAMCHALTLPGSYSHHRSRSNCYLIVAREHAGELQPEVPPTSANGPEINTATPCGFASSREVWRSCDQTKSELVCGRTPGQARIRTKLMMFPGVQLDSRNNLRVASPKGHPTSETLLRSSSQEMIDDKTIFECDRELFNLPAGACE